MTIIQITPGAGAMYCGNCFRDNALVAELRKQGHEILMVPLYLPLTLDESDQSADTPIFYSGINVYLEQKSALFREAPSWFHNLLTSRSLLKWAAGKAAGTRAADLGEITLSMLRGEEGNQARELDDLIAWLKTQPKPDLICLSNALLIGMVHRLKSELGVPIVCMLQGEDGFLDALPESHKATCWKTVAERSREVDLFLAPSNYFGELMQTRLGLAEERVQVVHNGINLEGYPSEAGAPMSPPKNSAPVLGYFARMCPEKGLDMLVDAYIEIRKRGRVKDANLRVGGGCGPGDQPFVNGLREKLRMAGLLETVEFCPNLNRADKVAFLRSLNVFSVPASYGEAFGLYVIEAMAAGLPVAQPRTAAFPELIEATGGGVLCEPGDAKALASLIEELLLNPDRARSLGETGRRAVFERFSAEAMAAGMLRAFQEVTQGTVCEPSHNRSR
jgi:glycosyltransferase involved in cell wall biosynthesis